jgi:hypothetical protein
VVDLADPDAVDRSGQIGTRMPFQQFAKLTQRHVTIVAQDLLHQAGSDPNVSAPWIAWKYCGITNSRPIMPSPATSP